MIYEFWKNLQFLRRMHNSMTQEDLAGVMDVSRQTISKWESDAAYPEMEKAIELCKFFSCSLDKLFRQDMNLACDAYSPVRMEKIPAFNHARYAVVSPDPEGDAINHMEKWAKDSGVLKVPGYELDIIGWDFPVLSSEQINVFHMHGYGAGCKLPEGFTTKCPGAELATKKEATYAVITIKNPSIAPFELIPNAYKTLMSYMEVNRIRHWEEDDFLSCFEKEYSKDGIDYMDVYIATEDWH